MIYVATAVRDKMLAGENLRDIFNDGCSKILCYSGTAPASADAAATGTLIATITGEGITVKAKQKIRFTPVIGTATAGDWQITLNGVTFKFVGDGTVTIAEVCTGLYNLIRAAQRTTAITTPPGAITIPGIDGLFTLTDNTTSLDIEAATAGVAFDYSSTVDGAGAGTATFGNAVVTADAYGLRFETDADATAGIIEKLASQTWKGDAVATGVVSHFRLVRDADTGVLSTTEPRIQGSIGVSGADMNFNTVQWVTGATYTVNVFALAFPAN